MELGIAGKAALVTGASSGIGRGIALALGAEGVRLAIAVPRRLAARWQTIGARRMIDFDHTSRLQERIDWQ